VAIFNPDHLFEQADKLIASQAGRPRQADIRRAISTAYYGIFHAIVTKAVDQFIGATNRDKSHYGLAYRSVSHSRLREISNEVQKSTQSNKYRPYVPTTGFGSNIIAFAEAVLELQERRHSADYDVMVSVTRSDAGLAVATARAALSGFGKANQQEQLAFLSLLLFSPR
jgi:uncharacterized protein (UPF0332 family)